MASLKDTVSMLLSIDNKAGWNGLILKMECGKK